MESKAATPSRPPTKHKRRFCRVEGCERIVKSQGLCQRHGAKPCKCKVEGCTKQSQGNYNGMCKAHFRQLPNGTLSNPSSPGSLQGKATLCRSVTLTAPALDKVPTSLGELAASLSLESSQKNQKKSTVNSKFGSNKPLRVLSFEEHSAYHQVIPASIAWDPQSETPMPLIACLKAGYDDRKPSGWHRNEERAARNLTTVVSAQNPLESWEIELCFIEILILTGNSQECFRYLSHAWGQPEGFHRSLGRLVCGNQEVNEVSETESEAGNSQESMAQKSATVNGLLAQRPNQDLCSAVQPAPNTGESTTRSPLDTLIALLSSSG